MSDDNWKVATVFAEHGRLDRIDGRLYVVDHDDCPVAYVARERVKEIDRARLIAAAPAMLTALRTVRASFALVANGEGVDYLDSIISLAEKGGMKRGA